MLDGSFNAGFCWIWIEIDISINQLLTQKYIGEQYPHRAKFLNFLTLEITWKLGRTAAIVLVNLRFMIHR